MSEIKIIERGSVEELTTAVNELLEEGWAIAGNNYCMCPETFWSDLSYSLIMLRNEAPHVPANPETIALYEDG